MTKPPIELEIRGEVSAGDFPRLRDRLRKLGFRRLSQTRRTTLMSFGKITGYRLGGKKTASDEVDMRCRVTNGRAEIVSKIGGFHSHNRTEISVPVRLQDMLRFAQMIGALPFYSKVGSKLTENFSRRDVTVSLVRSRSGLAYIEIEKITDRAHETEELRELKKLAQELEIHPWNTRQQFMDFCDRLTQQDDWEFHGTPTDLKKLNQEIKNIGAHRV